jgi:hypothetical protein
MVIERYQGGQKRIRLCLDKSVTPEQLVVRLGKVPVVDPARNTRG